MKFLFRHSTTIFIFVLHCAVAVGLAFVIQSLYLKNLSLGLTTELQQGLSTELSYLVTQGNQVAENESLKQSLMAGDNVKTLATLSAQRLERHIGLMGVADKSGTIIARTKSPMSTGENVLQVSPQGRALRQGSPMVASVEVSSFDPHEVLMTTGRPIIQNSTIIGYVFANNLLNDDYTKIFVETYMVRNHAHPFVAFYTVENGIYGSNFNSPSLANLARAYYTDNREAISRHSIAQRVVLNGQHFWVKSVPIPGLEGTNTGALIFIPLFSAAFIVIFSVALVLLLWLFVYFSKHAPRRWAIQDSNL